VPHDPERAADQEHHDEHAEGEGEGIIRVIGRGRQMKKEYEMHTNLRDRQRNECHRNGRPPDEIRVDHSERSRGKHCGKCQPDHIAQNSLADAFSGTQKSRADIVDVMVDLVAHRPSPIR
jgi:hypothetical protein